MAKIQLGGRRRWSLVATGTLAGALALCSAALACTPIMGPIRVCSPSTGTCTDTSVSPATEGRGAEGSTVKVRAWGLKKKPAKYALYMGPGQCHDSSMKVLNTPSGTPLNAMRTNFNGELDRDLATSAIEPIKAALPEVSNIPGQYSWGICAEETYPVVADSATKHARFTVVVM